MNKLREELRKYRIIIYILVIMLIGAVGFIIYTSDERGVTLPDAAFTTVEKQDVVDKVSVDGFLSGLETREVFAPVGAKIDKVRKQVGESVAEGNELYKLETVNQFGDVEFEEVNSPITGVVTAMNLLEGDQVFSNMSPAAIVVDDSSYIIRLSVNENDIEDIRVGNDVEIIIPAIDLENSYVGEVVFVAPAPIPNSSLVEYLVEVEPSDLPQAARLGMSVEVDIITDRKDDVLAIPETYLIERDDEYFVKLFSWDNNEQTSYSIIEEDVRIGLRTNEYVEILTGLREGDQVVEPAFTAERGFGFFN